jgi:RNase adaptor protein for sRNA GlmZ degradation
VINAGSGSRILRLRRQIPLLFGEESFATVCFDSFDFKTGSQTDAQCLFKSYLARNERVDAHGV